MGNIDRSKTYPLGTLCWVTWVGWASADDVLSWVELESLWVGLGWVGKNGPMSISESTRSHRPNNYVIRNYLPGGQRK